MKLSDFIPVRGIWMYPFWFGAFIFALMLLFIGALPDPVRRWTLPSFAVYLLGLGNLIFLKELKHQRYIADLQHEREMGPSESLSASERNLPDGWVWSFWVLQAGWLVLFVGYNVCKGVL